MGKRLNWTNFSDAERKYIKERDENRCILPYCTSFTQLGIAHVFKSRAKGGKGCRLNGVLLCNEHHGILDNPIGEKNFKQSLLIDQYCKDYLIKKENIEDLDKMLDDITYTKYKAVPEQKTPAMMKLKDIRKRGARGLNEKKCKQCKHFKRYEEDGKMPFNYCIIEKKPVGKNRVSCWKFMCKNK